MLKSVRLLNWIKIILQECGTKHAPVVLRMDQYQREKCVLCCWKFLILIVSFLVYWLGLLAFPEKWLVHSLCSIELGYPMYITIKIFTF